MNRGVEILAAAADAWNAAIREALRAVDARMANAPEPCRRVLTELRVDLTLLQRRDSAGRD